MVNESELRTTLIGLAELNKKAISMTSQALNEIASIRETVRALDPAFADVLSGKREYYQGATSQLTAGIEQECDSLIQRLKDGLVC